MKKLLFVSVFIGIVFTLSAQTSKVKHLPVELQKSGIFHIADVRTVDTATFVDVHITFIPGWRTRFFKTSFIKDSDSDLTLHPKAIIGGEFGKDTRTPPSGDTLVTLLFDPLPKKVKRIDFGQDEEMFVYGAEISGKPNKKHAKLSATKEKEALQWVETELANANNPKLLTSYDGEDFFRKDSVRIVGYLKGYDKRLGFESGIIYCSNQLTREDFPATIRIYENGTFEVSYEANYPGISYININNQRVLFYAEPGQTVGVLLDWQDFLQYDRYRNRRYTWQHTQYLGDLGAFNTQLFAVINTPDYGQLENRQKKEAPDDFKKALVSEWKSESVRMDSVLARQHADAKLSALIKANLDMDYASYLFHYTSGRDSHSKRDTTNAILKMPIPEDYYDFVHLLDLNNQTYIAALQFSSFINQFEHSPIFRAANISMDNEFAIVDATARQRFSEIPLMVHVAKSRLVKGRLDYLYYTDRVDLTVEQALQTMTLDFLKDEVLRLKFEKLRRDAGYDLPDTYGAEVFRKIIAQHQGKILIVDFWAEWCGPCRAGIEAHMADREKNADNPDFAFLFVTDGSTSDKFYKEYTAEQKMAHSYKVSDDDYLALRELFKFNGIPRYILVDADGRILNDDFAMHNWKRDLVRRFPNKFKAKDFSTGSN